MPRPSCAWREQCDRRGAALAVFPELGLSGYAIGDLLQQDTLLDAVEQAAGHAASPARPG